MAEEKQDVGPRLGADPELFVVPKDNEKKNLIIPVCGLVGGTKENPLKVDKTTLAKWVPIDGEARGDFAYQEDNVMFEFNIPASSRPDYFTTHIHNFLRYLETQVIAPKGLRFSFLNKYKFPEKFLAHPFSKVIGCSPDFCAYLPRTRQQRQPFGIETLGQWRFCGGHLHVQYNTENVPREVFAKFMDLAVSLPFLQLDKQGDRRKFYGLAGLYRPKDYGIEYRTPSNFWLNPKWVDIGLTQSLARNVLALARAANEQHQDLAAIYQRIPWPDVQQAIEQENSKLAHDILRHVGTMYPVELFMFSAGLIKPIA